MKTQRFIGDIHGRQDRKYLMTPGSIQLGDLGLDYRPFSFDDGPRFFVDGNHEDFPSLDPTRTEPYEVVRNLFHIPRGYVSGSTMFIGGGHSIDRARRIEGYDWYSEEAITQTQFHRIMAVDKKITTFVCHDCPTFVMKWLVEDTEGYIHQHQDALATIFNRFRPKLWIFTHYHTSLFREIRSCWFRCLNINEVRDIDSRYVGINNFRLY